MKGKQAEIIHILSNSGKSILFIFVGCLVVSLSVMLVDYVLITKPLYINSDNNLIGSTYSYTMIPIIISYFIVSLLTYYPWQKMRKAVLAARETGRRQEKQRLMPEIL